MVRFFSQLGLLLLAAPTSVAFTAAPARRSITNLYNVPPPSAGGDAVTIKDKADRESPPQSFYQLQINCARAAELAINDGNRLIEVEVSEHTL